MSEQLPKGELVIATTLHREHRSIIKSLFDNSKIPIKLFSNGTLYTERSDPLSHEATRQISIKSATVRYHFADEGHRFAYRVSTIISLVSSLLFFGLTMEWTDRILMGDLGNGSEDLQEHLFYFWPILLWISIDFLRDRIGKQERLEITYEKGKTISLRGDLPFQGEHNFSAVMISIGIATSAIVLSPEDDLSILLFGIFLWSALLYSLFSVLRWFLASQEGDKERSHQDLIQFYFAIMNIKEGEIKPEQFENKEEFQNIINMKEKLTEYQEILDQSKASKDIFTSNSPSLVVIAIGATTENLMKQACDSMGITRKKNARPTLQTFIHEYQTKAKMADKNISQLNLIREYRNRATHSFNIDWEESMIVMKQFTNFVEWYAEKFEVLFSQ
tara:strand:+ start:920 stop:2086 length:1167 start_codon:yes stop_codon:yes gene_type:complete